MISILFILYNTDKYFDYRQIMLHVVMVTLSLLVLSHAESNLAAKFTTLVKFPMGL